MSQLLLPALRPGLQRGLLGAGGAGLCAVALALAKRRGAARVEGAFAGGAGGGAARRCGLCAGQGRRVCEVCAGRGALARGGFSRRNTVRMASLVGSKWTAVAAIDGKWRHFRCVARRGTTAANSVARLASTCGPPHSRITLDVPVRDLRSRAQWAGGWTTLADIAARDQADKDPAAAPGAPCSACSGLRVVPCPRCDGLGQVGL